MMRTLSLVLALALLAWTGVRAEAPPQYVLSWGTTGSGPGEFIHPHGMDIGDDGRVYVADSYNLRIQIFSKTGAYITEWPRTETRITVPMDVATAPGGGNVYVVEKETNRVRVYTRAGAVVADWGGIIGSEPGQFQYPEGIAVDDSGYVYVADTYNGRVQKLTGSGEFIRMWYRPGPLSMTPRGIDVDGYGNVYVVDLTYQRVLKFTTQGEFLTSFGDPPVLDSPNYVAADATGNVYVTDSDHHRVVKFSPTGEVLSTWGSGSGANCGFLKVSGIAVDDEGGIYVSEPDVGAEASDPACIQKFSYGSTPTIRRTWAEIKVLYR